MPREVRRWDQQVAEDEGKQAEPMIGITASPWSGSNSEAAHGLHRQEANRRVRSGAAAIDADDEELRPAKKRRLNN